MGAILTYFVLIYQMQDGKADMDKLVDRKEILNFISQAAKQQNISPSETVWFHCFRFFYAYNSAHW